MAHDKSKNPSSETLLKDLDRCNYHLNTLFDISKDLFSTLDVEKILKDCKLAIMGTFGVMDGFIFLLDRRSKKPLHMLSEGIAENELPVLENMAGAILKQDNVTKKTLHISGLETFARRRPMSCVLPFQIDRNRVGLLGLGSKIIGEIYTEDEKQLIDTLLNNMVIALRHAHSFEKIKRLNQDLMVKKDQLEGTVDQLKAAMKKAGDYSKHLERIIAALNVAQEVQQSLLPLSPPAGTQLDIAGRSLYCDETGGDYFDYIALPRLGPDVHAIAVGDVSGHGVSSALLMAGVRAYLRSRAAREGSAAEIVSDVNRLVCTDTRQTNQFMTLFFLIVDANSKQLTWVRAGQEPAIVYTPATNRFSKLSGQGLPLGVASDWLYKENTIAGQSGQILILPTDGVMEARNPDGEMFGRERFKEVVRENANLKAAKILTAITNAVSRFRSVAPQEDDITLVVVKL